MGGYRNEIASFCDKREVQKETKLQSPIYIVGAILILTTSLDKKRPLIFTSFSFLLLLQNNTVDGSMN